MVSVWLVLATDITKDFEQLPKVEAIKFDAIDKLFRDKLLIANTEHFDN